MAIKYTIQIEAIPLSDADGGRANTVTAAQFRAAVDDMNAIFEPADIRFAFDPGKDWHPRRDTSLNSLNNGGGAWWTEGNAVAAQRRGRMVVFLRWGKDPDKRANNWFAYPPDTGQQQPSQAKLPTGNVDFVVTSNDGTGFDTRGALLAHEVGHYLGLFHTHPGWGNTSVETVESLVEAGGVAALNGDLLADTSPDPGAFYYRERVDASACGGPASFTIGGRRVTPPRSNVMSYFRCPPVTITAQQIQVVRSTLGHSHRNHLIETSAGVRYAGVFLPGNDAHALWVGDDWKGFTDKWRELSKGGLRLVDLESYVIGGKRRFSGVFRSGSGGHGLWVHDSWTEFTDNWKQRSNAGLRLHDFETWTEGSKRKFAGVYLAGSGGHALWYNDDWHGFREKWQELSKEGLRLVDVEVFGSLVS
jgi:hypothetical protein